jgi:hypothetical protein
MFGTAGFLKDSPTILIPFRVNVIAVLAGLLLSGLAGAFFPRWNVARQLNTRSVSEVQHYIHQYKADFWYLTIGFVGLLSWCGSHHIFDFLWWFGTLTLILSLSWLFLSPHFVKKVPVG